MCTSHCRACRPCSARRPTICRPRFPYLFPTPAVSSAGAASCRPIRPSRSASSGRASQFTAGLLPLDPAGRICRRWSEVAGVRLYSLQKQVGSEQLSRLPWAAESSTWPTAWTDFTGHRGRDVKSRSGDYLRHGGRPPGRRGGRARVGGPVLVPDWRWLLAQDDSPWYPTMRLMRQSENGRWSDVFRRIARDVDALVALAWGPIERARRQIGRVGQRPQAGRLTRQLQRTASRRRFFASGEF